MVNMSIVWIFFFFFFNDTATTEIYTLSLHDALPIFRTGTSLAPCSVPSNRAASSASSCRSEEHTSELQSQSNLVCRLLLEKKKKAAINLTLSRPRCLAQHCHRSHQQRHLDPDQ